MKELKKKEKFINRVAGVTRLELATSCVTGRRSNQLSYTPKGAGEISRTFFTVKLLRKKNDSDNRRQGGRCGEHR